MKHKIKCLLALILLNFFSVIVVVFMAGDVKQEDIVINNIPLCNSQGYVDSMGYFSTEYEPSEYWFYTDAIDANPGVYRVTLKYNTDGDDYYVHLTANGNAYPVLLSDDFVLDPHRNELSFQIWLNSETEDLQLRVECGTAGDESRNTFLHMEQISIVRSGWGSISYALLKVILCLLILDLLVVAFLMRDKLKDNLVVLIGLLTIILISSVGTLVDVLPQGHDLAFHLSRIYGLAEGIRSGNFPVKIQPNWCGGYGYAVSVFYGDILLYFPALLVLLKVPLSIAYKVYVWMINIGTVCFSYYSFKQISKEKYIGVTCCALYTLSIYRLCNIFFRAAVGEYTAMMFLPLVVLGIWQIIYGDAKKREYRNSWIVLCVGMSGIIWSHVLSCEMLAFFLLIVSALACKRLVQRERILALGKSILGTLGLCAAFLIPFLDYAREDINVFLEREHYRIQKYGLSIYELLSVGTTGQMSYTGNGLESKVPISLGFPILLIIVMAVIVLVKCNQWEYREKKQYICVMGLAGFAILLASNIFPWNRLETVYLLKKLIGTLEFPFRFMTIAMGVLSLLAGLILCKIKQMDEGGKMVQGIVIILCIACSYQSLQYVDLIIRNNGNYTKYDGAGWSADALTVYGGEYYYKGTNYFGALEDSRVSGNCDIYKAETNGTQYIVDCSTSEECFLEIPLFYYPGYQCRDTLTGNALPVIRGENNEVWVELPEGYKGTLQIDFVEPWYWRLAEMCSLITFVGVIWLAIYKCKHIAVSERGYADESLL